MTHQPGLRLALGWDFGYTVGAAALTVPVDGTAHAAVRDAVAEAALVDAVMERGLPPDAVVEVLGQRPRLAAGTVLTGFAVVEFLDSLPGLAALDGLDVVVEGEPVEYSQASEPPQVQLALTASQDDHDWFDLAVDVSVGDEQVAVADLVRG